MILKILPGSGKVKVSAPRILCRTCVCQRMTISTPNSDGVQQRSSCVFLIEFALQLFHLLTLSFFPRLLMASFSITDIR